MEFNAMDPADCFRGMLNIFLWAISSLLDIWELQDHYVELWMDKKSMLDFFEPFIRKLRFNIFPAAGYSSSLQPWLVESKKRFDEKLEKGRKCVLLYAGDLDPERWNRFEKITRFLDPCEVQLKRLALNEDQVRELDLPYNPKRKTTAFRPLDKMFRKRFPQFGDNCYELEAFPPRQLVSLMVSEVRKYYDPQKVDMERVREWERRYEEEKFALLEITEGEKKPPAPQEG